MELNPKLSKYGGMKTDPNPPVMQYTILAEDYFQPLSDAVNKAIREGWEPLGGVCDTHGGLVSQAMIKPRPWVESGQPYTRPTF